MRGTRIAVGWIVCAAAAAQGGQDAAGSDLGRLQRKLDQGRAEAERLLDLRLRHDLGLPLVDLPELYQPEAPATSEALERARADLLREERLTAELLERHQRLKAEVERAREQERERRRSTEEWIQIPQPGAPPQVRTAWPRQPVPGESGAGAEAPADPTLEVAPALPPSVPALRLEPVKGHIAASEDHGRVARALLRSAQALLDRSDQLRGEGRTGFADQFDADARDRLQRALEALEPALPAQQPSYADLFTLGRCREALFRLAERPEGLSLRDRPQDFRRREQEVREPWVAITARDVEVRNKAEVMGLWGRAAQAALDHFRWINLHGGFEPLTDPETITWERVRAQ